MSGERRRMRLGQAKRVGSARTFRRDRGIRRLRPRNDTEYLMSSPANVEWIMGALEEVRRWRELRRAAILKRAESARDEGE